MATPQQPELARSQRSEATAELSAKTRTGGPTTVEGPVGPIPEENLPGHHPPTEQDKPTVPPAARKRRSPARAAGGPPTKPTKKSAAARSGDGAAATTAAPRATSQTRAMATVRRFPFAFEPKVLPFSAAAGVVPGQAWAEVGDGELRVRFGLWSVRTPLANVAGAKVNGPYALSKVAGPPRLSLVDRGATFATSTRKGVCIRFREPVAGALPFGLVRHPAITVTVKDAEALADLLSRAADEGDEGGDRG